MTTTTNKHTHKHEVHQHVCLALRRINSLPQAIGVLRPLCALAKICAMGWQIDESLRRFGFKKKPTTIESTDFGKHAVLRHREEDTRLTVRSIFEISKSKHNIQNQNYTQMRNIRVVRRQHAREQCPNCTCVDTMRCDTIPTRNFNNKRRRQKLHRQLKHENWARGEQCRFGDIIESAKVYVPALTTNPAQFAPCCCSVWFESPSREQQSIKERQEKTTSRITVASITAI